MRSIDIVSTLVETLSQIAGELAGTSKVKALITEDIDLADLFLQKQKLAVSILGTIAELIQGPNVTNCKAVADVGFAGACSKLLSISNLTTTPADGKVIVKELQLKTMTALLSIFEGSNTLLDEIRNQIARQIKPR